MADKFCKIFNACFVEKVFRSHTKTENVIITVTVYGKLIRDKGCIGKDLFSEPFIEGIRLKTLCIEAYALNLCVSIWILRK